MENSIVNIFNQEVEWLDHLFSKGLSTIHFKRARLIFYKVEKDVSVDIMGTGYVSIEKSKTAVYFYGPLDRLDKDFPSKFRIIASDAFNNIYRLQARFTQGTSSDSKFEIIGETDRIQAQTTLESHPKPGRAEYTLSIPKDYVFPFSKLVEIEHSFKQNVIRQERKLDGYYGELGQLEVEVTRYSHFTKVHICITEVDEPLSFWDCVEEALEYTLGLPIFALYSRVRCGHSKFLLIRPIEAYIYPGQGTSPINIRSDTTGFIQSFSEFLVYSKNNSNVDRRSDLHMLVHDVYSASLSYISVQVVHLCFSIEWLARKIMNTYRSERCFSKDETKGVIKAVRELELGEPKTNRLIGLLSLCKTPSTTEYLTVIREMNVISDDHIRVWKKYRHKSAHGHLVDTPMPELSKDRFLLLSMFHALVRQVIRDAK